MSKIPFKVSARTARLIGRENISSSKGAIIELVKNGYDADSPLSIVYFDNKYSRINNELSIHEYMTLINKGIPKNILEKTYTFIDEKYLKKIDISEVNNIELKNKLKNLNCLYIIDSGEGMTQKIIREHWMTIGTDNKSVDIFTKTGRVKAGAKGIGRFALDKLGSKCEMITIFNPSNHETDIDENNLKTKNRGYIWKVNWSDFEGEFKTIDKVNAELHGIKSNSLKSEILKNVEGFDFSELFKKFNFEFGTILKISELRDDWDDFYVNQVFNDLEVLVPPKENSNFSIFLFSSLNKNLYGEITGSVCDDYDYKIEAKADKDQNIKITVYRNEYDLEMIDPDFFERPAMQEKPYRKSDFNKGSWKIEKTFSQLLPGYKDRDDSNVFENIGNFDFTLYFMKKTYDSSDAEKFFYRKFMANQRKDWLNKFGGVKLFRDTFRVRPYGEVKESAFDWLGLGARKAQSPAGAGKKDGGYRVNPDNVAGVINISRLTNVNFEDKSSREGLQENKTFQIFKKLIAEIINIFETDRAYIAREMSLFYDDKYSDVINKEKAEELAKSILENNKNRKVNNSDGEVASEGKNQSSDELVILAELNKEKNVEIEKLRDEQKVLRGLASSGIVLASFSHDLSKLNNVLNSRMDKLKNLISEKVSEKDYLHIEERKNPFIQLEKMRKQDIKLQNWLNFSLGAARKDKRTRKQLFFKKYFSELNSDWQTIFENRGIKFNISQIEDIDIRAFEIDFDSIFNNLFVNSIDAFNLSKVNREREILIKAYTNAKEIIIDYYDNGPGLSKDIDKAEKIFEALYTTKRNIYTGEEEGTGLGMWLVQSIARDNDAKTNLLFPDVGFGLRIAFPIKYKKSDNV